MNRQFLTIVFKYGLGIMLLAWVIWKNWASVPESGSPGIAGVLQRPLRLEPLALASLLCVASVTLTAIRWYVLVRAQSLPFTLGAAVRLGYVGFFFSVFMPGSVGGDIVKAYYIAREQSRRTVAVATVLIDRAVGLWGLFWLVALVGSVFWLTGTELQPSLQTVVLFNLGLIGVTTVLWCVLLALPRRTAHRFAGQLSLVPKVGHSLAEFWRAIWMYRDQWRSLFLALGMSLVSHCGFVATYYYAAQTFQNDGALEIPSLAEHFVLIPVGMAFQGFIPTPGGVGGGEVVFGVLYTMVGFPEANGVICSLTYRMLTWVIGLVGLFFYLRMKPQDAVVEQQLEAVGAK